MAEQKVHNYLDGGWDTLIQALRYHGRRLSMKTWTLDGGINLGVACHDKYKYDKQLIHPGLKAFSNAVKDENDKPTKFSTKSTSEAIAEEVQS
ncbi:hypothetical protein T265_01142 [Opisthorchis viverrini]|uniref:Uncharacterized protein n=1 Tax=Opisthorchis viverrini TaxID=6198 RepID=A0A074ZZG5_OPIVI|nr:hypothetical protein T265_01142 [Opisthorchis viverrini]KER32853.1 hypothetical protein T265_01142 [Opisthorchis viverrini]